MKQTGLEAGFLLDRQWHLLRGEMEYTKRPALLSLAKVLAAAGTPYAIIGGVALQVHQAEPRTTLDIDVAVPDFDVLPRAELQAAGFTHQRRYHHSDNWVGPEAVPVQFTDDPTFREAIGRAEEIELGDLRLRVIGPLDLLHAKLRSGSDPARRRSKRLQDLADAQALLEHGPELISQLSEQERSLLESLPE
jgi:hypothetical protein